MCPTTSAAWTTTLQMPTRERGRCAYLGAILAPFGALGAQMLTGTSLYGKRDAVYSERESARARANVRERQNGLAQDRPGMESEND